jgi:clan AA aspartic protease
MVTAYRGAGVHVGVHGRELAGAVPAQGTAPSRRGSAQTAGVNGAPSSGPWRRPGGTRTDVQAILDTGFTGHLTLPVETVGTLPLPELGSEELVLADGSTEIASVHRATVEWHGRSRTVSALAVGGEPLLGRHGDAGGQPPQDRCDPRRRRPGRGAALGPSDRRKPLLQIITVILHNMRDVLRLPMGYRSRRTR